MKRASVLLFLLILLAGLAITAEPPKDSFTLPVKTLYAAPDEESKTILKIPIEVSILEISADGNWYKVKITYNLGPIGYTYVGWARVPVGEIMAARNEKVAKAPVEETPKE